MICKCGQEMKLLFTSSYCSVCDEKQKDVKLVDGRGDMIDGVPPYPVNKPPKREELKLRFKRDFQYMRVCRVLPNIVTKLFNYMMDINEQVSGKAYPSFLNEVVLYKSISGNICASFPKQRYGDLMWHFLNENWVPIYPYPYRGI